MENHLTYADLLEQIEELETEVKKYKQKITNLKSKLESYLIYHNSEQFLKNNRENLNLIVNNIPVMIMAYDEKYNIIFWNKECERVTGYSAKEIVENPGAIYFLKPRIGTSNGSSFKISDYRANFKDCECNITCKNGKIKTISVSNITETVPIPGWYFWLVAVDVTKRKLTENTLKEAEREKSAILNGLNDVIIRYIKDDMTIVWSNMAMKKHYNLKRRLCTGKICYKILENRDSPCPNCPAVKTLKTGKPEEGEVITRTGKIFLIHSNPVKNDKHEIIGIVVAAINISARKKAEDELQRELDINTAIAGISTELLSPNYDIEKMANMILQYGSSLTKSRMGFVCSIDLKTGDNICHAHKGLSGKIKFHENHIDTFKVKNLFRPKSDDRQENEAFYENDPQKATNENFFPELSHRIEKFLYVPVEIGKKLVGHIVLANSIKSYTDKDMNAMIRIANLYALALHRQQFEKDRENFQMHLRRTQKMEAIGVLAGGIAHDFNNILFPIMGYVEMLMEDIPKDSPYQDHLKKIYTAANRARELVHQILTFSRHANQEIKPMRMQVVLKEVMKLIKASFPSTIEICQNIKDCGPVMADPVRIHQIAMNLITNAYQAMEEIGGTLEITLSEVRLTANDLMDSELNPGYYVCLTIADTGVGMEKAILERIFEPYFTTKKKGKGTGLGLAVVHGIVSGMKGFIKVYSEPGKGTVFHVYIPRIDIHDERKKDEPSIVIPKGKEKILLVDDEEPIVNLLSQMLKRFGYDVTSRTSSIEAIKLFDADPFRFDLVITDMTMPNLTGVQLARHLIRKRPNLPIILCTGFSEQISEEKAKAIGISEFIMKPVIGNVLARTIRKVLDTKKKED